MLCCLGIPGQARNDSLKWFDCSLDPHQSLRTRSSSVIADLIRNPLLTLGFRVRHRTDLIRNPLLTLGFRVRHGTDPIRNPLRPSDGFAGFPL